ncbi:putative beta-barrel porin [Ulvibacter sp. MAR_2010_11]|uniref:putative porin n=1 Tax=Ulvibacter sp. MAR_2010_11 TaxID=1250229 RepID=UPI000C2CB79A|nr:putative porin [Ulvibacter sp. MAR_2010_11]PKA83405.1 putative beta-barrel porin [Ulvibacter sp. MAR_2010_11]
MKKTLLLLLFLSASAVVFSQNDPTPKVEKPPIDLYKIISASRDTTYIDTTLSIQKEYKFNYLRKDNFELLPFANVGQTYNSLAYTFDKHNLLPLFAAQSHHFNYLDIEDMSYFHVPTPLTEIYFKTAFEQGQQLDAFFTINTSEQFNFSIAYKGVRSLGSYQNIMTSTGNFRFSSNYHTKSKRYKIRAHVAAQDVKNEENGGLTPNSIALFTNDDPEFSDRGRLDVNFEDAENKLEGLRFYGDHEYELISKKDSLNYSVVTIGNSLSYEDKFYRYQQTTPYSGFGDSYLFSDLNKKVKLEDFRANAYARFDNSIIGSLTGFVGYTDFNYGYDSVLILDEGRITNRLKGNQIMAGAAYKKQYHGFELSGKGAINVAGDFDGNYLTAAASFALDADNKAEGSITVHSVAPNFNFLLYQSDYVNYNWQNSFENVKTQELKFDLKSKKLLDATVSYLGIDDYAYFAIKPNDSTPTPHQYGDRVDYLKIKVEKELRYNKFALMNTVLFQQVVGGEEVFNVPQLVARSSLYYQDHLFKRALFLQTGINVKYFSKYNMNAYDPVLAEFYVQNTQELGGFPLVDIFLNAKIRQTRIYFKFEHVNSLFTTKSEYFSAPGYPYRDAVIRFGLVWDFFL